MKRILCIFCLTLFSVQAAVAGKPHSDGHAEVKGLPQLDPTSYAGQTFWLLLTFIFLYVVLSRKSLPAISQTISKRSEHIKNDLEAAERIRAEVTSVQTNYEESLKESRSVAMELAQNVEAEIKDKSEAYALDFQKNSEDSISLLERDIETARNTAMQNIGAVATDVALEAAEKIIGVKADREKAEKIMISVHGAG